MIHEMSRIRFEKMPLLGFGMVFLLPVASAAAAVGSAISPSTYVDTLGDVSGALTGRVLAPGDFPVIGAAVTLEPAGLSVQTAADGQFVLSGAAPGTGYVLQIVAAGYRPHAIENLDIMGGPQPLGDITLAPVTGDFMLRPLVRDVNPGTSVVEDGGVAYRFYLVRDQATNEEQGGVVVGVRGLGGGDPVDQTESSWGRVYAGQVAGVSDATGTVRLRIPASAVGGPGSSGQFETVVSDVAGPTFQVDVIPRKYEFFWAQESRGGLHAKVNLFAGARVGGEAGHRVEVRREFGESSSAEELSREFAGRGELGGEIGLPIGGRAFVGEVEVGAFGSAGAGGFAELRRAFGYEFDRDSTDADSAALRLYCIYAETVDYFPLMGPLLRWVREFLEPAMVDDVYRWSLAGFEFGPYVTVDAIFGAREGTSFAVGSYADVDFEGSFHVAKQYFVNEGRHESKIGLGGKLSATAGIGVGFRPYAGIGRPAGFRRIMKNLGVFANPSFEALVMGDQSAVTVVQDGSSYPSEVRLVSRLGGGLSAFGASLLTYLGAVPPGGEESAIVELELVQPVSSAGHWAGMKDLSGKLRLLFDQSAPVGMNALFGQELASALFPVTPYQDQADMRYELRVRVVDQNRLAAGAEGHVIAGGGFKVKMDLEKGRMVVLERGVIRGGRLYPFELTEGIAGIPLNTTTIIALQSAWFVQATPRIQEAWNRFEQFVQDVGDTVVDAWQATLNAAQGAWNAGTTIIVEWWNPNASGNRFAAWGLAAGDDGTIGQLYGVGGIYRFTADTDPAVPVTLSLSYQDEELGAVDESTLRIYRRDDENGKWALVGGTVDADINTVTAEVTKLGMFALAPPLPTGAVPFELSTSVAPADGAAVVTAEAENLLLNDGSPAEHGWLYTVSATDMEIINTDEDPLIEGIQVAIVDGTLTIEFGAPSSGAVGKFTVASVFGDANGGGMIAFEDTTPPPPPEGVNVVAGQSRVLVWWDTSGMPGDVAGYWVHYREGEPGPPFDGTAMVEGAPSPVFAMSDMVLLRGLSLGSDYHVAVSAVDQTGNEGPLSAGVIATTVEARPAPPTEVHFERDGDERFIISWTRSEDDGYNDRDVDHYAIHQRIGVGNAFIKIAEVSAGQSIHTHIDPALTDSPDVSYIVLAVDTEGLVSLPGFESAGADFNRDGYVDRIDCEIFITCFEGPGMPPGDVGCMLIDLDGDGAVDLRDFSFVQSCFSGSLELATPSCAR